MKKNNRISTKNLSFDDFYHHTKDLFTQPDKNLYDEMYAHFEPVFDAIHACSSVASVNIFFTKNDCVVYGRKDDLTAHSRMSSPWLREEDHNVALLHDAGQKASQFIAQTFHHHLPYDGIWQEIGSDGMHIFFNNIKIKIKHESSGALCAFFICAVYASFMKNSTPQDMALRQDLHHTFIFNDDIESKTTSLDMKHGMGQDQEDAKRVYQESMIIAQSMASIFPQFIIKNIHPSYWLE